MEQARQLSPNERLTERQREVLRLIERGHTNSEIAERLGISLQGAKWHVRELLGKYGAESREELIETRAAERGAGARVGRWLAAVGAFGVPKVSAVAAAGGIVIAASAGVAAVAMTFREASNPATPPAEGDSAIVAGLAVTPTPASVFAWDPLVPADVTTAGAPDALWTAAEAVEFGKQAVGPEVAGYIQSDRLVTPFDLDAFTLTRVEYHSDIATHLLADGDTYWDSRDGTPKDIWVLYWEMNDLRLQGPHVSFTSGKAEVIGVIEDGVSSGKVEGALLQVYDPLVGPPGLGGWTLNQHSRDAEIREWTEPSGPTYDLTRLNNVPDGPLLQAYGTKAGTWCYSSTRSVSCAFDPAKPSIPLIYSASTFSDYLNGIYDTQLVVQTAPTVVALEVRTAEGEVFFFQTDAPPDGVPPGSRFAYLSLGHTSPEVLVIGYDAAGNEVARRTHAGIDPPPGAGVPPPPAVPGP